MSRADRTDPGSLLGWVKTHPYTVVGTLIPDRPVRCLSEPQRPRIHPGLSPGSHSSVARRRPVSSGRCLSAYPPFMAFALIPLALLPGPVPLVAWLLMQPCHTADPVSLRWAWQVGNRLRARLSTPTETTPSAWDGPCLRSLLFAERLGPPSNGYRDCRRSGSRDPVLVRGRPFLGATLLGLAAACKCTPLLFAPYLFWPRRWLEALCLVAVALGVNVLPDLVSSSPSGQFWLTDFTTRYLTPLTQANHYTGSWGSDIAYNQSLSGAGERGSVADGVDSG